MLPVLRYYNVFNVEQCEEIDAPVVQAHTFKHEPIAAAEALWNGWTDKLDLLHRGNAAVYRRLTDRIVMLPCDQFETAEDYSVLFQEANPRHRPRVPPCPAHFEIGAYTPLQVLEGIAMSSHDAKHERI